MSSRIQGNRIAARVYGEGRGVPKTRRRAACLGRLAKVGGLSPQGGGLSVYILILSIGILYYTDGRFSTGFCFLR